MDEAEKMMASMLANWTSDPWGRWREKYLDPTPKEYNFVYRYVTPFDFEYDDFVEDENWRSIQKDSGIANLRQVLIEFVHQIRDSKGYDVSHRLPLIFNSPFQPYTLPMNGDEEHYDEVTLVKEFAIGEINNEMMRKSSRKRYELVSLDKAVRAMGHRSYLLTVTVKEKEIDENGEAIAGDAETLKTIRAMVYKPSVGVFLTEWKFKP